MSTELPENKTVSSAQEFKKQREAREAGDVITLASGLTVRLKRPEITKIIAQGLIPAQLVQRFMSAQSTGDTKQMKPEDFEALLKFQIVTAKHSFVEPRVVDEPNYDNNEISIEDLSSEDLEEVWAYANGGTQAVDQFRKER